MLNIKTNKKSKWGGRREGSGLKKKDGGSTKICVSVKKENWDAATTKWTEKPSWLVDKLLFRFIRNEVTP